MKSIDKIKDDAAYCRSIARTEEMELVEKKLQHRINMEELIAGISTSFINMSHDEIDCGVNKVLQKIGEFADVDRSYVFQFSSDGRNMDNTHEWCAKGIEPQIQNLKKLIPDDFPWFMKKLKRFQTIHIPSVINLPPEAHAEKKTFQVQEIKSLINVPMVYGNTLIGFLGFDSVRGEKTWLDEDIKLLKTIAEILVNALERKKMEEALMESEERYRTIIEYSNDMIWILDTEGRFSFFNKRSEEITGFRLEAWAGKSFAPLIKKEDLAKVVEVFHKTLNGDPQQYEVSVKKKDGSTIILLVNTAPVYSKGKVAGTVSFGRDITERKKAEEQIKESLKQELKKSNRQKKLLCYLIEETRGGKTRALILRRLMGRSYNAHQLARALNMDYKTIRHHLDVLMKNGIITKRKDGYSDLYSISENMESDLNEMDPRL